MNAEAGKQPAADQGTHNSNTDIGDETESGAADDLPSQPATRTTTRMTRMLSPDMNFPFWRLTGSV
jgi:hypothetical protein